MSTNPNTIYSLLKFRLGAQVKRIVAALLLLPALSAPVAAFADDDQDGDEHVIGPATVDDQLTPTQSEPVDIDNVVISTKTPADDFVTATTPLALALGVGSIGLVIYTMARNSGGKEKD